MAEQGALLNPGRRAGLAAAALSLLLPSCGPRAGLAVLADPRWWAAASASVEPQLARLARERGLRLEVIVSSEGAVPASLQRRPPRLVLAGPLTAVPAAALAAALPGTLVLTAGAGGASSSRGSDADPPNLLALAYGPQQAFAEAGRRAAAAGGACPVAILAAEGSHEAAAFRRGFVEQASGHGRLRERPVPPDADRARLRGAVDELHGEGARLFVIALGALTPSCLEMLEGRGSLAVVEGQQASGAFASVVQATIEPDWAAAVASALDGRGAAADGRTSQRLALEGRLVESARGAAGWLCGAASRDASPSSR